jgi:hypothetical protein
MVDKEIQDIIDKAEASGHKDRIAHEIYSMTKNLKEVIPIHTAIQCGKKDMLYEFKHNLLNLRIKENIKVLKSLFDFTEGDFNVIRCKVSDALINRGEF